MNAVTATDLVKRYGGVVAVDGLTLTVQPGEILGLLGPNGAGKTTAIHRSIPGGPGAEASRARCRPARRS